MVGGGAGSSSFLLDFPRVGTLGAKRAGESFHLVLTNCWAAVGPARGRKAPSDLGAKVKRRLE